MVYSVDKLVSRTAGSHERNREMCVAGYASQVRLLKRLREQTKQT